MNNLKRAKRRVLPWVRHAHTQDTKHERGAFTGSLNGSRPGKVVISGTLDGLGI